MASEGVVNRVLAMPKHRIFILLFEIFPSCPLRIDVIFFFLCFSVSYARPFSSHLRLTGKVVRPRPRICSLVLLSVSYV